MSSRRFAISPAPIPAEPPFPIPPEVGALVSFDGIVRDMNHGRRVLELEYTAYHALAQHEGERIVNQAVERFGLCQAACIHRVGRLPLGEVAVRVWAASAHRQAAFAGCAFIIDAIKADVPIWKNERYADGERVWIAC